MLHERHISRCWVQWFHSAAGDMFYVVEEGEFTIYDGGAELARVGPGSCFGELALLHGGPRAATVLVRVRMSACSIGTNIAVKLSFS